MKATLIYGREGSGKSGFIHRMCNAKRSGSKIAVLVPDQYTHQTELDLIAEYNSAGLMDTEVLSFKRLSHRLKLLYGGASVIVLSEEGRAMLVDRIISLSPELKNGAIFSNAQKTDICGDIAKLIARLKQYSVTPEMLISCAVDGEKYSHTRAKLDELALIYKNYTELPFEYGEQSFFDDEDDMELLCRNIRESGALAEYEFFIDGFDDFSKPELAVIEALITATKSVTVSLPCDYIMSRERRMLFKRQMQMLANVEAVVEKCGISAEKIWLTDDISTELQTVKMVEASQKRAPAIAYIEKNIFNVKKKYSGIEHEGLCFVKESNIESEAEHMADKIVELVRDKGCRYNELAVICSDTQKYKRFIVNSFKKRNIPFFMDIKRSIKDNALIRYILGLIDVCVKKRASDSVIAFLKSGLLTSSFGNDVLPFSYTDIAYLEKYCTRYYINGKAWDNDFVYGAKYFDLERLNLIRKHALYYIAPMETALSGAATAKAMAKAIENYADSMKINDAVNTNIEYLRSTGRYDVALEYNNIWNVFVGLLSQINMYMGEAELTVDEFLQMLHGCLDNVTVNVIPACIDQVTVCGTGRTMAKHIKALFVLGAENISVAEESSVFNAAELDMLKAKNIDIGADSDNVICDEEYYIYKILSKPTELLYISSTDGDTASDGNVNPTLINAIKSLFGDSLHEIFRAPVPYALGEADNIGSLQSAMLYELTSVEEKNKDYCELDEWLKQNGGFKYSVLSDVAKKGKSYTLTTEQATPDSLIKQRYDEYIMDISRLERYARCPYSYFVRYCLAPQQEVYAKASALDIGNVVHDILDMFNETVMKMSAPSKTDVLRFMDENFDRTVDSYESGKFNATNENKYILRRTRSFLIKIMTALAQQKCSGKTTFFAAELPFDDSKRDKASLPSVECISEDGTHFKITGKIDCVEYLTTEHGRYWIVSDYKTGKNPDNNEIVKGKSLQLPIYMFALLSNDEGSLPGAMFYVSVNDNLIGADRKNSAERKYGKVGIVAENEALYEGLDENCKDESKNRYDIKISDMIADTGKLDVIKEEQLAGVISAAVRTAGDIFCDIKNGYIVKAPSQRDNCKYCEYRRFCGYDPKLKNVDGRRYVMVQDDNGEEVE